MASKTWLEYRNGNLDISTLGHAYYNTNKEGILEILTTALFYDFHCLMSNEIIYLNYPRYLHDKKFKLNNDELIELDHLTTLILEPDSNFEALRNIWENNSKFRIMRGGTIVTTQPFS